MIDVNRDNYFELYKKHRAEFEDNQTRTQTEQKAIQHYLEFKKKIDEYRAQNIKNVQTNIIKKYIENQVIIDAYIKKEADKKNWDDFNKRNWEAYLFAGLYGGMQGWGMGAFASTMLEQLELDPYLSKLIGLVVAIPVAAVNTWLVRPDIEDYWVFKKYKTLFSGKNQIKGSAIFLCGISSLLLGGIVAYGISSSLKRDVSVGVFFGVATCVLSVSEFLLNLQSIDEMMKKGFNKQRKELYARYESDENKTKAARYFWGSLSLSILGMIGIALVGTKCLSNNLEKIEINGEGMSADISMTVAVVLLISAALTQVPFYRDRAEKIALHYVKPDLEPVYDAEGKIQSYKKVENIKDPQEEKKLIFSAGSKTSNAFWLSNAFFNAPCAYLGVVTTLSRFCGIDKLKSISTDKYENMSSFERVFFQYGNSLEASIIYGAGAAFFVFAVAISLAANYVPPKHAVNPEKELKMRATV